MTWVQLTEQEAKMQQGWKEGHILGIHIFHLLALFKCIATLGELVSIINTSTSAPALTIVAVAFLIYSWRKKQPMSLIVAMVIPPLVAFLNIIIYVPEYTEVLLVPTTFSTLLWFLIGWLYAVLSSAYRLNYKYELKVKQSSQKPVIVSSQSTPVLNPVSNINTEEQSSLQIENKSDKESTREVISTPQVLMVVTIVLVIALYILFMQAKR